MARTQETPRLANGAHPALDPNVLMKLEKVVDAAWRELMTRGSPIAKCRGERVVRKLIARRVFSQVNRGELDPDRLKQHAVSGLIDPLNE